MKNPIRPLRIRSFIWRFQRSRGAYLKPTAKDRLAEDMYEQKMAKAAEELRLQAAGENPLNYGAGGYEPLPKQTAKVADDTMWDEAVHPSEVSNVHINPSGPDPYDSGPKIRGKRP